MRVENSKKKRWSERWRKITFFPSEDSFLTFTNFCTIRNQSESQMTEFVPSNRYRLLRHTYIWTESHLNLAVNYRDLMRTAEDFNFDSQDGEKDFGPSSGLNRRTFSYFRSRRVRIPANSIRDLCEQLNFGICSNSLTKTWAVNMPGLPDREHARLKKSL